MAFSDILQGVQFFAGLSQGFSKQLQDQQKLNDANNLHLLTLLDKDKTHSIEQVEPDEIVPTSGADKLFGTNRPQTKDGLPAFKIGGNYFTARKLPTYTPEQLMGSLNEPQSNTIEQTPLTLSQPGAPSSLFGPASTPQTSTPSVQPLSGRDWAANYRKMSPDAQMQLDATIAKYAKKYNIPLHDAYGLIAAESGFDPNARSDKDAFGYTQLMPKTARDLGVDRTNPEQNIEGGLRYYRQQLDTFKDPTLARAAYNAGPKAVENAGRQVPMNGETPTYVKRVDEASQRFQRIFNKGSSSTTPTPSMQPDTSMQVAGEGAPAPSPLPPLPPAPTLPKEATYIRNYVLQNSPPTGFTGPEGVKQFQNLRKEATEQYKKHIGTERQEKAEIRLEKSKLLDEEHDPNLRPMLESVQNTAQLDHYLTLRSQMEKGAFGGRRDPITEAIKHLQSFGDNIPDQEAAKTYNVLSKLGVKRDVIKDTLDIAGYKDQHDLDRAAMLQRQKEKIDTEGMGQRLKEKGMQEQQTQRIHEAGAQGRIEEDIAKKKAEAQLKMNAPLGKENAKWINLDTGGSPKAAQTAVEAESAGHVELATPKEVQAARGLLQGQTVLKQMRTLLLGGNKKDIDDNAKEGEKFPGILPSVQAQSYLGRAAATVGLKQLNIAGSPLSEWAQTYERFRKAFGGAVVERGLAKESGRIPAQVEQRGIDMLATTGLNDWLGVADAPGTATKSFDMLDKFIHSNLDLMTGGEYSSRQVQKTHDTTPTKAPEQTEAESYEEKIRKLRGQ